MARNVLARTYPGSKATAWCHAAPALSRLPVSSSAIASRSQASALRESSARARRIARSTGPRVVGSTSSEAHARLSHASTLVLSSWSARSLALISRVSKLSGGTPRTGNPHRDRKSTRLNSSHGYISYAVFCLKKKKTKDKLREQQRHESRPQH